MLPSPRPSISQGVVGVLVDVDEAGGREGETGSVDFPFRLTGDLTDGGALPRLDSHVACISGRSGAVDDAAVLITRSGMVGKVARSPALRNY